MSKNSRTLLLVLAGGALLTFCLCTVFLGAAVVGWSLVGRDKPTEVPAAAITVEAEPEEAEAVPATEPAPTEAPIAVATLPPLVTEPTEELPAEQPATATPTAEASPEAADLDAIDLSVLLESWRYIEDEFDGPLPTPEEMLDATVLCSVEVTLGEEGLAAYRDELDAKLAGQNTTATALDSVELTAFYATWTDIQDTYNGVLPTAEELREATIACSIESVIDDEHTRYAPPAVAERMREGLSGQFEGIGAFVRMNEEADTLEIVRPIDGQPADLAGLKAGDLVTRVDGEDVVGQTIDEIIAKVRGPQGSVVMLTILREGLEPFDVTITRARIEIPVVEAELLEEGVAYVRLSSFSLNATAQVEQELEALLPQAPNGLILDLRDNPGGFLDQAVSISDLFLANGLIVQQRDRNGLEGSYSASAGELAEKTPLVVLVNAGSASASEIVAGALQENGRALLLGEASFGKGSVQLPHELSDGGELRVTIARWYTPDNNTIDGRGITPDIVVPTPEDLFGPDDTQIRRAIDYLLLGS